MQTSKNQKHPKVKNITTQSQEVQSKTNQRAKQKAKQRRLKRIGLAKPQRHIRRHPTKWFLRRTWSSKQRKKTRGTRQQRPIAREDKGEQKKKGKQHQRREKEHRNDTKKNEAILEAVRDAGFPSFPLTKKTLL